MTEPTEQVRAAGTVLWRPIAGERTAVEVALVHRSRHDDWSLPKGKLERGETWAAAAARETWEETGHRVSLGPPLPTQEYVVDGRPKVVRYWAGRSLGNGTPAEGPTTDEPLEVDVLEWLPPGEARARLSYHHDTHVVDAFERFVATIAGADHSTVVEDSDVLVLLRHAKAVKRAAWDGVDAERPLDPRGHSEAAALVPWLAAYGPVRVMSSNSTRCMDTVAPYAASRGMAIEQEPLFSEEAFAEGSRRQGLVRLQATVAAGGRTVLCTHRPLLPSLVRQVAGRRRAEAALPLPPAAAVVIHHVRGDVLSVERHLPDEQAAESD